MRVDVEFPSGAVTLRGWLYRPEQASGQVPLVVMTHGFAGVKEWVAPFAEVFSKAGLACLVYDHPGFGTSDGEPRFEVDPFAQIEGYRGAITFAQALDGIDPERVGIWGTSFAGGHVLVVAATDRRVRAVVSQVPLTNGWANFRSLVPSIMLPTGHAAIAADRQARASGKPHQTIKAASDDPTELVARYRGLQLVDGQRPAGPDLAQRGHPLQHRQVPVLCPRSVPTPRITDTLLMIIADQDTLTPADIALHSYAEALEPKQLALIPGPHFAVYEEQFQRASGVARDFLLANLRG
ncbi:alpha/beta fold hydrolase [Nocardia vinacea]|uniref:alpha/beta hydrolase n=1 Tax=Nocardia vinacea TaxID=96468 RepID=UPI003425E753